MGLLRVGKPMKWQDALPYLQYVREHGVQQFLNIYDKLKDRKDDVLKWGDEVSIKVPGS
jgi:glutamate--cysteine ligase catalytic subunit